MPAQGSQNFEETVNIASLPLKHKAYRTVKTLFSKVKGKSKTKNSQVEVIDPEIYWPLDLLPSDCSNTRIFTWGYDSQISKFFVGPSNRNNVFAHAKDLLYVLGNNRLKCQGRALIFIAHSLGGIIVKEVLRRAAADHDKTILDIYLSTKAVFFLGTPHRGSDIADYGEITRRILSASGLDTSDKNIRALQIDSSELQIIHEGFVSLYERSNRQFEVCTFQEAQGLTGFSYAKFGDKVVWDFSSTFMGTERILSINANHMSMCRFASKNADGYQKVVGELQRCLSNIQVDQREAELEVKNHGANPPHKPASEKTIVSSTYSLNDIERLCIALFSRPDISEYQSILPSRVEGTCEWVLSNPQYIRWLSEEDTSILWISGHCGSGKTLLSAYILDYLASYSSSTSKKLTVCYFFCDDKIEAQRDGKAILQSLIYQIIVRRRALVKYVKDAYDVKGPHLTENFNEMWRIFTAIIDDQHAGSFIIIIDAIDECEQSTRNRFLKAIASLLRKSKSFDSQAIKFLLTSRLLLWHQNELDPGQNRNILPIENLSSNNESDLKLFIQTKIDNVVRRTQCHPETRNYLEQALYSRADRTFLWVTIVLHILERTYVASQKDFHRIINQVPKDLTTTYEQFLLTIPNEYQAIAKRLLHLITGSMRVLSLGEVRILLAVQPHHRNLKQVEEDCQPNIRETLQGILGPFVRISHDKVSLVHQSAKEFLQDLWKQKDNPLSQSFGVDMEKANTIFTEATVSYLLLDNFGSDEFYCMGTESPMSHKSETTKQFWDPFKLEEDIVLRGPDYTDTGTYHEIAHAHVLFDYSARFWAQHYLRSGNAHKVFREAALALLDVSQDQCKNWFRYYWYYTEPDSLYPSNFNVFIMACYFGHLDVLNSILATDFEQEDYVADLAMYWAARKGNEKVVDILCGKVWKGSNSIELHPLITAAQFGCLGVAKILLSLDRIDPNALGVGCRTSLSFAVSSGHIEIVKALLEDSRVKWDVPDVKGWTPFFRAVGGKHLDIIQLFTKNPGINVNHVDLKGRNIVSWAGESGESQIIKHLLTLSRLDFQHRDLAGRDALSWAAAEGHLEVIKLLIESKRVRINGKDDRKRNAISWAAGGGHHEVVHYLVKCDDSESDIEDLDGWTPLAWAVEKFDTRTVQVLLASGKVDPNRKDKNGRTPLSWAAAQGNEDVVRAMVRVEGINIDERDLDGQTPMSRAEAYGFMNIVNILKKAHIDDI